MELDPVFEPSLKVREFEKEWQNQNCRDIKWQESSSSLPPKEFTISFKKSKPGSKVLLKKEELHNTHILLSPSPPIKLHGACSFVHCMVWYGGVCRMKICKMKKIIVACHANYQIPWPMHREGWMDDKRLGNSCLSGSTSLANHGD